MFPPVSIGVPICNGAKYLRQSVESVLAQTFENFELVLIDDLSEDDSWTIAQEYSCKDARVSAIRNSKRLGLVANFNRCIQLTTGRYLCVWHQDDEMAPQNIEKKVALLAAHPQVGFVHSNVLMIDEKGNVLSEHWEAESRRDYVCSGREFFLKMLEAGKNYVCCPSVLARRECYEKLGQFRDELYFTCDWEMWMRLALYYDVGCLGAPLVYFRRHGGSESDKIEGTIPEIEQELLAKSLVLADHGQRIPDADKLKRRMIVGISRQELLRARSAFSQDKPTEAWTRLRFALKLDPASLWRAEFTGTLARLMLGPKAWRWLKTAFSREGFKAAI